MFHRLAGWLLWLWHVTDPREPVDGIIARRIKEIEWGQEIAEDLKHNSREGNMAAIQHAAYLLDLPLEWRQRGEHLLDRALADIEKGTR